eukprot:IDg13381t1
MCPLETHPRRLVHCTTPSPPERGERVGECCALPLGGEACATLLRETASSAASCVPISAQRWVNHFSRAWKGVSASSLDYAATDNSYDSLLSTSSKGANPVEMCTCVLYM